MSLTPSLFQLKREFQATGQFHELMAQAERGDIIKLFDSDDELLKARFSSKHIRIRHMNSYIMLSADTQSEGQNHLWLYRYDGMLLADLGIHPVDHFDHFMPVAMKGVLNWKARNEEVGQTTDTLVLIRTDGSEEVIFTGDMYNAESDSGGNIWILQKEQFIRFRITESGVEMKNYLTADPMFLQPLPPLPGYTQQFRKPSMKEPDYIISGNSLWVHDPGGNFLRVGPDGAITTIDASLITHGVKHWYAQDEWLAVLGEDEQTLQMFKDGVIFVTVEVGYAVNTLIAVGNLGAVYGTNWDGQYSYFLITSDGRNILLTDYNDGYFCVMVPEGVIMPPQNRILGSCLSLMVYK
jgi:hypothetical protein